VTHTYKTTHARHNAMHGVRFSIGALTLAGIFGAFSVHWGLGLVSILPLMFLNGKLNYYLNASVTLSYLRKDCGIDVTWDEATK